MILIYFVILPLLAAFLIALIAGKKDTWGISLSLLTVLALELLSLYSFFALKEETLIYHLGNWPIPVGIVMVADSLTFFMLLTINTIALTSLIFSIRYIRHLAPDWKYYALFMLLMAGMHGVVVTGDIFNLFVFMEIALIAAFSLVAYGNRAEEFEAAFKYGVMGSVSSTMILIGIAILYSSTSTLTMARIAEILPSKNPYVTYWVGALFLAGFGLKAAAMPFHAWLPDAHSSAPAPISSMLSGVLIKTLGIYVLIRLFFHLFTGTHIYMRLFLVLGVVSILIGALMAIIQWDLKRLLAYSSISQIGYILLGMGLATPLGILGAVYHILNHALFKSLLFYNSGAVELSLGTRNLKEMGNLRRLMPVTTQTSMIASLAIAGIPPFNGFFSKLVIIIAALQAGYPIYALLAVVGSIMTLATFMVVQRHGFRSEREVKQLILPETWSTNTAMIVLAVLCVLTSILIVPGIREVTLDPVVQAVLAKSQYVQLVMGR